MVGSDVIYTTRQLTPPVNGQCWRRGPKITSVRTTDFVDHETGEIKTLKSPRTIKSAIGFKTVARAEKAYKTWEELGFNGSPASPASIARKAYQRFRRSGDIPMLRAKDANRRLAHGKNRWLWIEARTRGHVKRSTWHYDINEAYWWATSRGLPSGFEPYQDGDKSYVAVMDISSASKDLPSILEGSGPHLVTSEDVAYYGLRGTVLNGVSYSDLDVSLAPVFDFIGKHFGPWIGKKARQTIWGLFSASSPIIGQTHNNGEKTKEYEIKNPLKNIAYATLITRRVVRRVHGVMRNSGGISCFVDSVLCTHRLREGTQPGEWRKEHHFPNGIYIRAPGVYDGLTPRITTKPVHSWYRHSGYKARENSAEKEYV